MAKRKASTTAAAALVRDQGFSKYAAAKKCGVSQSSVRRALARDECKCPMCGQVVRSVAITATIESDQASRMIDAMQGENNDG